MRAVPGAIEQFQPGWRHRLRAAMRFPPPDRHPPLGLDLVVNPDGTTTAWNKDKTKVFHSHGPPARAG